jgi:hypothetical protein
MIADTAPHQQALAQLREIRGDLLCARVIALQMTGAHELVEKIAAALVVVGRLIEGDDRC